MSYYNVFHISDKTKEIIVTELVEPNYKNEIQENMALVKYFRRFGLIFESASKIFVGVSSILSFSAGIYQITELSFMAGVSNVISLVFIQFSSYAYRESKKNESILSGIFKKMDKSSPPTQEQKDQSTNIEDNSLNGSEEQPASSGRYDMHSSFTAVEVEV